MARTASQMERISKDQLIGDLRVVMNDAEDLLKVTADQTGERVERARAKAVESLRSSRAHLDSAAEDMTARAQEYAREVDLRVRDNAWTALGVAAGVGLVAGLFLGRR